MLAKPAAKKQCLSAPHLLQARTMGDIQPVHFDASAMLGISPPCAATAAQTKGDAAGLQHHRQLLGSEAEANTCRRGVTFSRCFLPWYILACLQRRRKTTLMSCLCGKHEQGWHYAAP